MPWNLLILPLLGGYWFATLWYGTRFKVLQLPRVQLLIWAATAGLILLVFSRLACVILDSIFPALAGGIQQLSPAAYLGTALGAFLLGPGAAALFNAAGTVINPRPEPSWRNRRFKLRLARTVKACAVWLQDRPSLGRAALLVARAFPDRTSANDLAIEKYGDQLQRLFWNSLEYRQPVMLSLRQGKVYVGWVSEHPANIVGRQAFVKLIPLITGYRDAVTQKITFTTYYDLISTNDVVMDKVILVAEITSASFFDPDVWDDFQDDGANCQAMTTKGRQCSRVAKSGSVYCAQHDKALNG